MSFDVTATNLANIALSHLGHGIEIQNLDSERSAEARACRRFFDLARQETLRSWCWPFATRFENLALVGMWPTCEWEFSYRYPANCLEIHKLLSGIRNDTRITREVFKIASDDQGRLIYTDKECAQCEYTYDYTNFNSWTSDFVLAFTFKLAALIAARITGGDPFKMGDKALANFSQVVMEARINGANEEQPDPVPDSEMVLAREGRVPFTWRKNQAFEI